MQYEPPASYRTVPAVVRGPFNPVAYVLVDGHLLLPAIWQDSANPAPTTGKVVTVRLPCGRPTPQMLPLAAYLEEPESAPPAVAPLDDDAVFEEAVAAAEAAVSEDAAVLEDAAAPEVERPESAQQSESQEAS